MQCIVNCVLNTLCSIFITDKILALFDVWLLGNSFLKDIVNQLESTKYQSDKDPTSTIPLFITEYFNVELFCDSPGASFETSMARIVKHLSDAIIAKRKMPKYLVIIPDKDPLHDIDCSRQDTVQLIQDITRWLVRTVDTTVQRRRIDFLDCRPGAVAGLETKIIFIRMLRRIGSFHEGSKMSMICKLRAKFNDALNDACAKVGQYMLTIASCNAYEHFDKHGNLSRAGKQEFWLELDELLEPFDSGRVKLLPNPKNPPHSRYTHTHKIRRGDKHNAGQPQKLFRY